MTTRIGLSLHGGGIRGLIQALVLAWIEEKTGKPISQLFDMISGTSTGGILAIALSAKGEDGKTRFSAEDMASFYCEDGPAIFKGGVGRALGTLWGLASEKYKDGGLNAALIKRLGGTKMSDLTGNVMVTAWHYRDQSVFLKSWESDMLAWHAARATAAAPTYFRPFRELLDGGVCANHPGMCMLTDMRKLWPDDQRRVLSIGTGRERIMLQDTSGWGVAKWATKWLGLQPQAAENQVDHFLKHWGDGYLRVQHDGDAGKMNDASPKNLERLAAIAANLIEFHGQKIIGFIERIYPNTGDVR